MICDRNDIRRMHDDLEIADDCIRSLLIETNNSSVSEKYIKEKAEKAKRCLEFVLSFTNVSLKDRIVSAAEKQSRRVSFEEQSNGN